jgi:hypothetical protein
MKSALLAGMRSCAVLLLLLAAACGTGGKERLLRTALHGDDSRREWLEATLRVLDDHPEYIDELYVAARGHERVLGRFTENMARDLHDEKLARMMARYFTRHPSSLRQVMIAALDEAREDRAAREAIAQGIQERGDVVLKITLEHPEMASQSLRDLLDGAESNEPLARTIAEALSEKADLAANLITDHPDLVYGMLRATVDHVLEKPDARRAFVLAMSAETPRLARVLGNNPKLLARMLRALLREARKDPELAADLMETLVTGG